MGSYGIAFPCGSWGNLGCTLMSRRIDIYFISKYISSTYCIQGPEGLLEYKDGICSKGTYKGRPENQDCK